MIRPVNVFWRLLDNTLVTCYENELDDEAVRMVEFMLFWEAQKWRFIDGTIGQTKVNTD